MCVESSEEVKPHRERGVPCGAQHEYKANSIRPFAHASTESHCQNVGRVTHQSIKVKSCAPGVALIERHRSPEQPSPCQNCPRLRPGIALTTASCRVCSLHSSRQGSGSGCGRCPSMRSATALLLLSLFCSSMRWCARSSHLCPNIFGGYSGLALR